MSATINYEILEHIAVISDNQSGWKKEINLIRWNGREAKYDIREWSPDHEKMGKGITLTKDELLLLKSIIEESIGD